jgi:hypothetical protein
MHQHSDVEFAFLWLESSLQKIGMGIIVEIALSRPTGEPSSILSEKKFGFVGKNTL